MAEKERDKKGRYIGTRTLSKEQTEVINLIVWEGKKGQEVWQTVGIPKSTYYDYWKIDLFKEELENERKAFRRKLKNKAWKKLEDALENAGYRDALGYVKLVLEDNEDNYYLNKDTDTAEKTKQDIVINIIGADSVEVDGIDEE